ncbi:MAG: hypothetical protein FJ257_13000, partial [Phycisphaerae bacterium]|nr:hypothetical protein [Phycisphaerae bacterium]
MSELPIRFEHPGWLSLLVLLPIAWWLARRGAGTMSAARRWISFLLRAVVIGLLAVALAEPSWIRRGEDLTVVVVADASRSVPQELALDAERFLRLAAEARERPEDRLAVVTTARKAEVAALPEPSTVPAISGHAGADDATNLAEGMKMALAILPSESAARILLVSDGNETADRVLEAAELARANGVAVDVLPLRYRRDGEVVFEELRVPTRARRGQTVDLRMFLRSGRATTGRLSLLHDDRRIDLDPGSPSDSMTITLEPGVNAFSVPL